ncbi:M23 family metallopeptidase [Schlegelella sp. S2-27]|uniref:M23 family metallopeptidase n=1 Tax=Caldimonas mangrovi TaxID=2944811 RepID=A0ABT0YIE8_9BURK|nr:M23 family metallopeptidase [Caldimonas mangrovi]MCM5677926.1 M23 family metallopeptidase [Caldimonas mangrovi]
MAALSWPLAHNTIRRQVKNNAFGNVRNGGTRPHQGWDLYAPLFTPCYAIADGKIEWARPRGDLGNLVLLRFEHGRQIYWAAYAHLGVIFPAEGALIARNEPIALTGTTGNAASMSGDDLHLHFEIRTMPFPGNGLGGRVDPALLYGYAPIGSTIVQTRGESRTASGVKGLLVPGVNVLEGP